MSDPTFKVDGEDIGNANVDLSLGALGAGITYYIMPANVYLSGSVGVGNLTADVQGSSASIDSGNGLVLDATLGKEWWVGSKWGLGVAGAFGYHTISDEETDDNLSGPSFAVRFTATMN